MPSILNSDTDVSTDLKFRAFVTLFSTAFAAGGLVKTADAGQIDPTTVTRPAAVGSAGIAGYEIWRFDDALQATKPVFIKVEYGTSGGVVGGGGFDPRLRIQVGTATNGSGVLTGLATGTQVDMAQPANAGVIVPSYFNIKPNLMLFACFVGAMGSTGTNSVAWVVAIERSRDVAGNVNGDGIGCVWALGQSASFKKTQFVAFQGGAPPALLTDTSLPAILPYGGTNNVRTIVGADIAVAPVLLSRGNLMNPGTAVMVYDTAEISNLSIISLTVYGLTKKYLVLGNPAGSTYWTGFGFQVGATGNVLAPMILWE